MMKRLVAIFVVVMLALSICSCSSKSIGIIGGADGETSIIVEDTAQNIESTCSPLIYKATDKDGNIAWLLGAIHVGREDFYPLPDYVMNAFNSSNAFAIECDTVDFENVFEYMEYADGTTIKDHIDEQLYEISSQILEENGILEEVSDSYMPSVWSLYVDRLTYARLGFEEKYGVDTYLTNLAFESNIKVLEIEGDEIHGKSMAKLSDEVQEMMLISSVSQYSNIEQAKQSLNTSLDLWSKGDEAELSAVLNTEAETETQEQKKILEEYDKVMRVERNDQMTEYVKNAMQDEKELFVCVGSTHIVGENGIVAQLRELGYVVEVVKG